MMKKDSIATTAILLSLSANDDLLLAKDESDKQVVGLWEGLLVLDGITAGRRCFCFPRVWSLFFNGCQPYLRRTD
jgi:hypothetical protein